MTEPIYNKQDQALNLDLTFLNKDITIRSHLSYECLDLWLHVDYSFKSEKSKLTRNQNDIK